jgi:hypothetical protein
MAPIQTADFTFSATSANVSVARMMTSLRLQNCPSIAWSRISPQGFVRRKEPNSSQVIPIFGVTRRGLAFIAAWMLKIPRSPEPDLPPGRSTRA